MTSVKAALTVILKANDVIVAEVEDAALWQQILTAINNNSSTLVPPILQGKTDPPPANNGDKVTGTNSDSSPVAQLAAQIGIELAQLQGACAPTSDGSFMHLDLHCWEEMKKQLPARGVLAIAPVAVPATLLALWFTKAGLGSPTQAQAQGVLSTISLRDPNASRSIQNTVWLQSRPGGQIVLNPAEFSKALKLAKCFCTKDWASWKVAAA